jgi:hypothetical protein
VAERLDLPLVYVRAEAREPGGPLVECEPGTGDHAVIIEDVVASGGSVARAIRALLAETSLRVEGAQSIANWNFPEMRDLLAPWTVRAVTSYPQVLDSAREASWGVWVLPWLLSLDNITYGAVDGVSHGASIYLSAFEQALSSTIQAGVGLAIGIGLAYSIPAVRRNMWLASGVAGGLMIIGAGVLHQIG